MANPATLIHLIPVKLSSANYLLWGNHVQKILESEGLFGYIDGTVPCPPAAAPSSPTAAEWVAHDKSLQILLRASFTKEPLAITTGCTTAKQIWDTLTVAYKLNSKLRRIQVQREMLNLQRGNRSVADLDRRFKGLFNQLNDLDSPVDNEEKVWWFLQALGTDFVNFSSSQFAQKPLPSYSDVVGHAINYENIQKFLSDGRNSGQNNRRRRNAPKCQLCHEFGHVAPDCDQYTIVPRTNDSDFANIADAFHSVSLEDEHGPTVADWLPCEPATVSSDWYVDTGNAGPSSSDWYIGCEPASSSDWYIDSGAANHTASASTGLAYVVPNAQPVHRGGRKGGRRPRRM